MKENTIIIIAIVVIGAIIIFIFRNRIKNLLGIETEFQDRRRIIGGAGIIGGSERRAGGIQNVQVFS